MPRIRILTPEQKRKAAAQQKAWRDRNEERLRKKYRQKYLKNRSTIRARSKARYEAKKKEIMAQQKINRRRIAQLKKPARLALLEIQKAATKARRLAYNIQYEKRRAKIDVHYKVGRRLRSRLRNSLKRAGAKRAARMIVLLGCSLEDCKRHLEAQFREGMSWSNYGAWHIDHKRPCASFDLSDPEQQRACFHFSNLQPLWGPDNIRKSNRVTAPA